MIKYEDFSDIIDVEIQKRRVKWTLTALNWLDFNDVGQIIKIHISKKLHLYYESRPFLPWVNTVISAQLKNIVRNNYSNYTRPCLRCAAAEGENLCRIFTRQCSSCPLYEKWERTKKNAYNTKLPVSIEAMESQLSEHQYKDIDFEKSSEKIHAEMQRILKANEWTVYKYLYIDGLPEEDLAVFMGYKTNEKNRSPGYKQIKNIKKKIITLAKKFTYNDLDI